MTTPKNEMLSDVWRENIFENKVVFCTGGSGDICSAQVRALVYLGANACIVGRDVKKTRRKALEIAAVRKGARVEGYGAVDVRDFVALQKAAKDCVHELGGIDFLIAGAAGNFLAPISQLSPNAFKAVIDIDLIGSYNAAKATLPYLLHSAANHKTDGKTTPISGTGGRALFISATLQYTGKPLQTHACAAKAGIDALSSGLAIEMGPRGMTSNIIAPGPIADTEGMKRLAKAEGYGKAPSMIPTGRLGTVKEIADATIYLFSEAGNYVNGATLVVDGGAWRTHSPNANSDFDYPDFLLSADMDAGMQNSKL